MNDSKQWAMQPRFGHFDEKPKSGMRPISDPIKTCPHHDHRPPTHLHIPYAHEYVHVCPGCGNTTVMRSSDVTMMA